MRTASSISREFPVQKNAQEKLRLSADHTMAFVCYSEHTIAEFTERKCTSETVCIKDPKA